MRKVAFIFFLLTINIGISYAQIAGKRYQEPLNNKSLTQYAVKKELFEHDFSNLFTLTDNSMVYGFIGDDFMRIRIKIISVTKDTTSPETYNIYGKSMVKGNIADFNGKIKISKILKLNITQHGCEDGYKFKGFKGQFSLFGVYLFAENKNQNNSGIFKGVFRSDYFVDKNNKVKYDDIENCSDDFTNNQFVGTWTSYKNNISKKCNWGDYRIPNSGDFDIGAGDFSPNTTDVRLGWQTIHDMWKTDENGKLTIIAKQAKHIEEAKWWL